VFRNTNNYTHGVARTTAGAELLARLLREEHVPTV